MANGVIIPSNGGGDWTVINANLKYKVVNRVVYCKCKSKAGSWVLLGAMPTGLTCDEGFYYMGYYDGSHIALAFVNTNGNIAMANCDYDDIEFMLSYPLP